jgi:hypothetical protein
MRQKYFFIVQCVWLFFFTNYNFKRFHNLGKKFILSMLFVMLALQVSGQHRFNGLGPNNSGGSGFKSIATNSVIVVSNNATGTTNGYLSSTDTTAGGTQTITLKADGVYATSFDVNDLSIFNFKFPSQQRKYTIHLFCLEI